MFCVVFVGIPFPRKSGQLWAPDWAGLVGQTWTGDKGIRVATGRAPALGAGEPGKGRWSPGWPMVPEGGTAPLGFARA